MSIFPHKKFYSDLSQCFKAQTFCQALIDLLESSPESQMRVDNYERPNFSQISLHKWKRENVF